ncbi:MAG TPA: hypothetical protein VMV77_05640 [Bacteroidales bacterium]|nr:hypothetical protein [Bacteroidales bacterium]
MKTTLEQRIRFYNKKRKSLKKSLPMKPEKYYKEVKASEELPNGRISYYAKYNGLLCTISHLDDDYVLEGGEGDILTTEDVKRHVIWLKKVTIEEKVKTAKEYLESALINPDILIDTVEGEKSLLFILEHYAKVTVEEWLKSQSVISSDLLTKGQMRDYIIRIHGMATGDYVQSDTEMRSRIGKLCEQAIEVDGIMKGFLGRGGKYDERDILQAGGLDD